MVQYESIEAAKEALSGVKGTFIGNSRRIMVRHLCVCVYGVVGCAFPFS